MYEYAFFSLFAEFSIYCCLWISVGSAYCSVVSSTVVIFSPGVVFSKYFGVMDVLSSMFVALKWIRNEFVLVQTHCCPFLCLIY